MKKSRREMMQWSLSSAATMAFPAMARGQQVYAVTYPGSIDESFKAVLGPAYSAKTGNTATFTPMLNLDLIGKLQATRANPAFDVALFDDGPLIGAIKAGLIEKFPTTGSRFLSSIPPVFLDADGYGPTTMATLIGIAYNPKKVKAPTGWGDLFKSENKGKVGIVGPTSTLGTSFLIELGRTRGGTETEIEPAFDALKALLPNVGAIAPSPGALSTLMQQGQVDIAPNFFSNVAALRAKGADIAFAVPSQGLVLQRTSVQLINNSKSPEAALQLADMLLDPEIQTKLEASPWVMMPSNPSVALTGQNREIAASVEALLKMGRFLDWKRFVDLRAGWIERFNKEVRI